MKNPNVVYVFTDQWRASAAGYSGDPNVKTPNVDKLAAESVNFVSAVSNCPICTPYRASLLTGQYPLTTGLFMNDLCLTETASAAYMPEAYNKAGYDTAYIGKWHLDGHGRSSYIPGERRLGFEYWKSLECTHDYWNSLYYENSSIEPGKWEGYDAFAQTEDAVKYIERRHAERPFLLMLSFAPPHDPYHTAPERNKAMYREGNIILPPNISESCRDAAPARPAGVLCPYFSY